MHTTAEFTTQGCARSAARSVPKALTLLAEHPGGVRALPAELDDARSAGHAAERADLGLEFCCVATPLFDENPRDVAPRAGEGLDLPASLSAPTNEEQAP